MKIKLFEVRDRLTFIPVMAIEMSASYQNNTQSQENWLLRRAGYGNAEPWCIVMTALGGKGPANYDQYAWDNRTFSVAHDHVIKNWDKLSSGDVIDVEFILGESKEKKISERFTAGL
jgi:hypothetical protein